MSDTVTILDPVSTPTFHFNVQEFTDALSVATKWNDILSEAQATTAASNVTGVQPVAATEFPTPQAAASNAIDAINPTSIANNTEYTGKIILNPITGMYYATPSIPGTATKAALSFNKEGDQLTVGDYHTHGNYFGYDAAGNQVLGDSRIDKLSGTDSENFSPADRRGANALAIFLGKNDYTLWLGTPSGAIKQYSTSTGQITTLRSGN